jgi:hypothetical protein
MERHDPLSAMSLATDAAPAPPEPPKSKRGPKLPPLLKALTTVPDDSLAFLYGGPGQGPEDYERNKAKAPEIRRHFTAFCEANLHFTNWRQAWAAFMAQAEKQDQADRLAQECNRETVAFLKNISPKVVIAPVQTPVTPPPKPAEPSWRARMRRITIYG